MAIFFIDGFDKYMPVTTSSSVSNNNSSILGALLAGEWNSLVVPSTGSGVFIGNPLSATGGALTFNGPTGNTYASKTLPANYTTLIGGFRFGDSLSAANAGILFFDGTTQQGGIVINTNGTITIQGANGATVATSSQSVSANTTHYLEWSIAFASSGAYSVYLDGTQIMSGTANFKQSSNAYANTIRIGTFNSTGNAVLSVDDLYLDDGTGSILATNPVVETHTETSDSQAQFSVGASVLGAWLQYSNSTNAPGANTLFLRAFTPTVSGTLASVSTIPSATSSTAKFKAVVYADSSNKPGSLLATGNEVVGTGTAAWNNLLTSAFSSGPSLTAGTQYWIGFITDTSVALNLSDNNTNGQQASNTYTSGAPGTAPTMSTGKNDWILWGNLTGVTSHTYEVTESPPLGYLGDYSYVQSNTVGQEDLFNVGALVSNPSAIYAVAVKGFLKDSDAGARTVTLQTKSGSTDSSGSSFTPSTTYQWFGAYWANDPNGNVAWTVTNLNNALDGYKVNS